MSDALVPVIGLLLALAVMLPFAIAHRRRERATAAAAVEALRYGLHEPVSLHPVVDPAGCIGTGNCISVCPEETVLGMRHGQAVVVAPARCIGHGLCERACPVDAIRLVFGTERRGVDIPRIRENFETNVPGLYIVGELGGMGLIGNAFEQGRQCADGIFREGVGRGGPLDAVVVGCGPAGLSTSLNLLHRRARFTTIEREDIGGTVRHYPRKKLVLTRTVQVPGYGKLDFREIPKEDLMEVWHDIVQRTGLEVRTGEPATGIDRLEDGTFSVTTTTGAHHARRVVLAIGRRGVPRRLGVPGEDSPDVAYSLREPEAYQQDRILVVGGGDSAVEAALALAAQPGNTVHLSYRGERFGRIKEANRQRIDAALQAGHLRAMFSSRVLEIAPGRVHLENGAGRAGTLDIDRVFVFIGGELPTAFLRACGVAIDTRFGTAARVR